jgi:hypothetical protein
MACHRREGGEAGGGRIHAAATHGVKPVFAGRPINRSRGVFSLGKIPAAACRFTGGADGADTKTLSFKKIRV